MHAIIFLQTIHLWWNQYCCTKRWESVVFLRLIVQIGLILLPKLFSLVFILFIARCERDSVALDLLSLADLELLLLLLEALSGLLTLVELRMIFVVPLHLVGIAQERDIESLLDHWCSQNPANDSDEVKQTAKITQQVENFVGIEAV